LRKRLLIVILEIRRIGKYEKIEGSGGRTKKRTAKTAKRSELCCSLISSPNAGPNNIGSNSKEKEKGVLNENEDPRKGEEEGNCQVNANEIA